MSDLNISRAKQLIRASAITYLRGAKAIKSSPLFSDAGFLPSSPPKQVTSGIDSVVLGKTSYGFVLAFRGTQPLTGIKGSPDPKNVISDWFNDGDLPLEDVNYSAGQVHRGFQRSLNSLWDAGNLLDQVSAAADQGLRIFFTGHSKGGALATLAARRFKSAGITPANVITFGSPRVGNEKFADTYDVEVPNHWRVEHGDDIVPHLPPSSLLLTVLQKLPGVGSALGGVHQINHHFQHVGQLSYIEPNQTVVQGASLTLQFRRETHLAFAGSDLFRHHSLDSYSPTLDGIA